VQTTFHDIIDCLVAALEARDVYTSGHSTRVADMSCEIALELGLEDPQLEYIHMAAHLHDIGKLGIPEAVLNKKGTLSLAEWEQIRMHPEIGYKILSKSLELEPIAKIVLHHHERWDGTGYPCGLKRKEIPLGSRIIAVADSIDAMTSHRPYREALTWEQCRKEISANKGIMYDADVVEACNKLWEGWEKRQKKQR